ncbi:protein LTO1 homolog isoform X5 [Eptesicus fuscus]|uniref:protein LTO1 homolog isoform X5 n=1 Tax=Eptesicus fuscus TaxID=29078 RepID=UPI002403ECA8|nr:protein LTO1 homolog isoform X5 [Eptesicus fuscus]
MAEGQDLFDAIVMADDRFRGEGYQEGYEEGSGLGIIEGRQHGTVYGAKIGSEIGCYQGFAFAWRCLLHSCATEKDSVSMDHLGFSTALAQIQTLTTPSADEIVEQPELSCIAGGNGKR